MNRTPPPCEGGRLKGDPHEGGKVTARFLDPQADLRRAYVEAFRKRDRAVARLMARGIDEWSAIQAVPPVDFTPFGALRCGARGKRTGLPCPHTGLFASGRCRWHGGLSTGPTTPEGKARSARNGRKLKPHEEPNFAQRFGRTQARTDPLVDVEALLKATASTAPMRQVLGWIAAAPQCSWTEDQLAAVVGRSPQILGWSLHCLHRWGLLREADSPPRTQKRWIVTWKGRKAAASMQAPRP